MRMRNTTNKDGVSLQTMHTRLVAVKPMVTFQVAMSLSVEHGT